MKAIVVSEPEVLRLEEMERRERGRGGLNRGHLGGRQLCGRGNARRDDGLSARRGVAIHARLRDRRRSGGQPAEVWLRTLDNVEVGRVS